MLLLRYAPEVPVQADLKFHFWCNLLLDCSVVNRMISNQQQMIN